MTSPMILIWTLTALGFAWAGRVQYVFKTVTSLITVTEHVPTTLTVTEHPTATVRDCETTVTVSMAAPTSAKPLQTQTTLTTTSLLTPLKEPEPIEIVQAGGITYAQFQRAVSFYNLTAAGGNPPPPSYHLYQGYLSYVVPEMDTKEQAMLLANLIWESTGFQHTEELACVGVGKPTARCPYGMYHGRGFIQLSWDYNYRAASRSIFGDDRLLMVPDLAKKDDIAWQVSLWYWKEHVRPRLMEHNALKRLAFGYSVRAINGNNECEVSPKALKNMRSPPKKDYSSAQDRLTLFNALLKDWHPQWTTLGTLDGCITLSNRTASWDDDDDDKMVMHNQQAKFYDKKIRVVYH